MDSACFLRVALRLHLEAVHHALPAGEQCNTCRGLAVRLRPYCRGSLHLSELMSESLLSKNFLSSSSKVLILRVKVKRLTRQVFRNLGHNSWSRL